jgi:hypothetical protein
LCTERAGDESSFIASCASRDVSVLYRCFESIAIQDTGCVQVDGVPTDVETFVSSLSGEDEGSEVLVALSSSRQGATLYRLIIDARGVIASMSPIQAYGRVLALASAHGGYLLVTAAGVTRLSGALLAPSITITARDVFATSPSLVDRILTACISTSGLVFACSRNNLAVIKDSNCSTVLDRVLLLVTPRDILSINVTRLFPTISLVCITYWDTSRSFYAFNEMKESIEELYFVESEEALRTIPICYSEKAYRSEEQNNDVVPGSSAQLYIRTENIACLLVDLTVNRCGRMILTLLEFDKTSNSLRRISVDELELIGEVIVDVHCWSARKTFLVNTQDAVWAISLTNSDELSLQSIAELKASPLPLNWVKSVILVRGMSPSNVIPICSDNDARRVIWVNKSSLGLGSMDFTKRVMVNFRYTTNQKINFISLIRDSNFIHCALLAVKPGVNRTSGLSIMSFRELELLWESPIGDKWEVVNSSDSIKPELGVASLKEKLSFAVYLTAKESSESCIAIYSLEMLASGANVSPLGALMLAGVIISGKKLSDNFLVILMDDSLVVVGWVFDDTVSKLTQLCEYKLMSKSRECLNEVLGLLICGVSHIAVSIGLEIRLLYFDELNHSIKVSFCPIPHFSSKYRH